MYTKGLKKRSKKGVTWAAHNKMCSFITLHDATDVANCEGQRSWRAGTSTRAVAHELNVNFSTINHLQRLFREFGSTF